ncbi:MAG: hypothetical protein ACI4XC_09255 [Eubacterium sp.]
MDKKCPYCGQSIPEEASFCLHCFTPLNIVKYSDSEDNGKSKNAITAIVFSIIIIVVLTAVLTCSISKINNDKAAAIYSGNSSQISTEENISDTATFSTKETATEKITTKKATDSKEASTASEASKSTSATTEKQTTIKESTPKKSETKATVKATEKTTTSVPAVVISNGILSKYPSDRKNKSYTIPYDVTRIEKNAFNNKYIKTLTFSKRENVECDWANLFAGLKNLETVYVYPGTSADLEGLQYFDGEIVYYD